MAQAASWVYGSVGRPAPLYFLPWAVTSPGHPGRQPRASGPAKSAHPWAFRHVPLLGRSRWDSPGHAPSPGGRVFPGPRHRRGRGFRDSHRLAPYRAGGGPLLGPRGPFRSHSAQNSLEVREALRHPGVPGHQRPSLGAGHPLGSFHLGPLGHFPELWGKPAQPAWGQGGPA